MALRRAFGSETVFAIMPINVIVDLVEKIWCWIRYRKSNKWKAAQDDAYLRGVFDGRSNEHARLLAKVRRFDEEARRSDGLEWRHLVGEYDNAVDLLMDDD